MTTHADVIVVGAGAAGLMAARDLSKSGQRVVLIEARDRIGGRILGLKGNGFDVKLEGGAEFVHGNLPLTLQLLQEYGIVYHHVEGEIWNYRRGHYSKGYDVIQHHELLEAKLAEVTEDMTIARFMQTYFPDPIYRDLCDAIKGYIEGYDAGDPERASTLAFKKEWQQEAPWEQYRINGGYSLLMHALWQECHEHGVRLFLSEVVKEVHWNANKVEVITDVQSRYTANRILLTLPLGVWQAPAGAEAGIAFYPPLPRKTEAAYGLGFGHVVKFLLEFREAFWKSEGVHQATGADLHKFFFLFSDAPIPTWWSQEPQQVPLLTGWLSGPDAQRYSGDEKSMTEDALKSLALIFRVELSFLKEQLLASRVLHWSNDPYTLGAYSYSTLSEQKFMKQFMQPVDAKIYFAGEALDRGYGTGTVEAALGSGKGAAEEIMSGI